MKSIARKFIRMKLDHMKMKNMIKVTPSDSVSTAAIQSESSRQEIIRFLSWAYNIDVSIALQAYRLVSGLMHRRLVNKISEVLTVNFDDNMVLGSQRFFPSDLNGEGAVFGRELLYGKLNRRR